MKNSTTDGHKPTRLLALMNQKGGVGKTTTTVNLAAALAHAGRRALIIDLDPQAHATLHLGEEPAGSGPTGEGTPSVYDLLLEPDADPADAVVAINDHLHLVRAETDLAAAETELAEIDPAHRLTRLRDSVEALSPAYDFILIDCPPSLGLLTLNALVAAREVLIPMQAHFLALQGMSKLLETVQRVRGTTQDPGPNPRLRVAGVVLCMHDRQATHTQDVVAELTDFFEAARDQHDLPWRYARVYNPAIRRNIKLAECPSFGQSIFDYAPDANGAKDYAELASAFSREWDAMLEKLTGRQTVDAPASQPEADAAEIVTNSTEPARHAV